ncbi:amino acid ABC transporter permease [Aureimonas fodinaquatilis]|uniref:Amino acid ABC transporter permease n=1 Tax=Aureimonas fodinaquatilis TaxID=2565783 RepID=A0A5B0DT49_9HYPH|nr:amino acid ABC transporter permease [Aureimonas fodinaquatilis]KAA0969646.1 amino acid ABC transporter permease [Aureimonas fodinaquatilis]
MLDLIHNYWLFFLIGDYPNGPIGGLAMTMIIALLSLAITFPLAVLMALARISPLRWISWPATGFVYVIRGMPLLMLLFWVYFFLPVLLGFPLSGFWSIVISIVVFQTAYLAEVIRAAIEALPRGQDEAARSLGMRYWSIMFRIILPQALFNAIPGILNQLTAIIKETSLGYILAVNEITYVAGAINGLLITRSVEVFLILAATYFILCSSVSYLATYLENRINRKRARVNQ